VSHPLDKDALFFCCGDWRYKNGSHRCFKQDHVYARPGSGVYHRVVSMDEDRPHFACNCNQQINDLMSTRLTAGVGSVIDAYGQRRCKRCFP